jgi:asparagine synthase (glutamine-hydrolysing)
MMSADGRLVLVFNGEIYNHRSLRKQVEAAGWPTPWRGHSDTETLLAALQLWGVAGTLPRLNGMFAFAVWDREQRLLSLARDRFGEKPLFYGVSDGTFLFASELKALTGHPDWHGEIDRDVLTLYLRHAYVPDPYCIYKGMNKLPPAHWMEVRGGIAAEPVRYWDLKEIVQRPRRDTAPSELLDELEVRLKTSIGLRMEADVPLGAFLSGGIDSSAIVALMQTQSSRPIRTFTIGFEVPGFNEAECARAVAAHLGTEHEEVYLTHGDALDVVADLPRIWDEPFADSSQIPTLLLSRMARQHVTVALSGDAGDEVFCGYNRYGPGFDLHKSLSRLPGPLRKGVASLIRQLPAHAIDRLMPLLPGHLRHQAVGDRLKKLGDVLDNAEGPDYYRTLTSLVQAPDRLVLGAHEPPTLASLVEAWPPLADFREVMMYLDTTTYLPGDILTKVDRASMAASLEVRTPFLDHELVEFAWSMPLSMKLNHGETKWALREVLRRHVPRLLIDRPKSGFGVPLEHWLSGPLRGWAEELLGRDRLKRDGLLDVEAVRDLWSDYLSGKQRNHHLIWSLLMFNAWMDNSTSYTPKQTSSENNILF